MTNASGSPCFKADYLPYGAENTPSGFTDSCNTTYKFTGYERDGETGNDYAFARYYNQRLGRFMSGDPLGGDTGDPQSLNRYAYVRNNPINFIDPTGMECFDASGEPDDLLGDPSECESGSGGGTWDDSLPAIQVTAYGSPDEVPGCGFWTLCSNPNNGNPPPAPADPGSGGGGGSGASGGSGSTPQTQGQSPLSPKAQVCKEKVQNAVNAELNTPAQFQGPLMDPRADSEGLIHGAYNFNFYVPGVNLTSLAATGANCGRFASVHIIIPLNGCNAVGNDPFVFNASSSGTLFTAHIDSATPDDLVGVLTHFFRDYVANRLFGYNHGC